MALMEVRIGAEGIIGAATADSITADPEDRPDPSSGGSATPEGDASKGGVGRRDDRTKGVRPGMACGLPGWAEQRLECVRGGIWDVFAAIDSWRQSSETGGPSASCYSR
jgi:hypothetical protein